MKYKKVIFYISIFLIILIPILLIVLNISRNEMINSTVSDDYGDSEFKSRIEEKMWDETNKTFSKYYELLGYKLDNYEEFYEDGVLNATFLYTFYHKNYDKDPDTVGYIKEAKLKNDPNYEILYNEYLERKEGNLEVRAVDIDGDNIKFYTNDHPGSEKIWEVMEMDDYVLK